MKNLLKHVVSSFVLTASCIPTFAMAENIVHTEPVTVSATRVEKAFMDVPMSVSLITQDDIKKNPSTTVAELLRDIPGLTVTESSPGLQRISIRGESESRTLVLVDGQKISDQKSMSGVPILVDPAAIERIEVIRGPASVLYGSDAIGGVINIITKKNPDKLLQGSVSLGYFGENNGFTQSMNLYGANNGWNYNVSASNGNFGDQKTPYGDLSHSDYDQQDFRGLLSYDFSEKLTAGITASYYRNENNTAAYNVVNERVSDNLTATMTTDPWEITKVGAFLEAKDLTDYLARVRVDVYYQDTHKNFSNVFNIDGAPMFNYVFNGETDSHLRTYGASLQTDWHLGDNHYLIAGYDFYHDDLTSDDPTVITKTQLMGGGMFLPGTYVANNTAESKSSQTNHAVYLAMESFLPAEFTLNYGVRYTYVDTNLDYFRRTGTNMSPGPVMGMNMGGMTRPISGFPTDATAYSSDSNSESRPVFNAGLVWSGLENMTLRLNWAQGFRVPTLAEKYVDAGMMGTINYANPNLKPETSDNFEFGVRYNNNKLMMDVVAFYSIADDYIDLVTIDSTSNTYQNVAKAKTFGLEASLRYDFENGLSPYIYATLMRREFDHGNNFKTYKTGTPLLSGRVGLMYNKAGFFNDMLDVNANFYVSGQTGTDYQGSAGGSVTHYDGFATLNLGFGADFGKNKEWNIQVELLNLLDKTYFINADGTGNDIPETGFNANAKITWKF